METLNSLPADLHKVRFKGETGLDLMRMNRLEEAVCALLASSSGGRCYDQSTRPTCEDHEGSAQAV